MNSKLGGPFRAGVSLLCGAALALCLPRPGLCFLAWVALVPLIDDWARGSRLDSFWSGLIAGFAFHAVALNWIYSTCRFAGIGGPVAVFAWSMLALLLGLQWGLIAVCGAHLATRAPVNAKPWIWAASWAATAFIFGRFTPRFAADLLCYTQYRHLALIQMGAFAGPYALGFVIVAWNAALAQIFRPRAWLSLVLAAALIAGCWVYGRRCLSGRTSGGPNISVAILQPNIDQYQKWNGDYESAINGIFRELVGRSDGPAASLMIWPESSLPRIVAGEHGLEEVIAAARVAGATQLVGAVEKDGEKFYNSAFLINPPGHVIGQYRKRELVPFGEYVPLTFLRRFIGALGDIPDLSAGVIAQPLLVTALGPTAVGICYESVFPFWARYDAARGARVLINLTNDGWYKDTWGPYQHFEANIFRAIENRVTVIRAGNTGISGVIDPWGVVTAKLDLNTRGRLDADVAAQDMFLKRSFYARHGDWLGWSSLIAVILIAV